MWNPILLSPTSRDSKLVINLKERLSSIWHYRTLIAEKRQEMSKLEDPNLEGFKIVQTFMTVFWNSRQKQWVNGNNSTDAMDDGHFTVWPVALANQAVIDAARINKNFVPSVYETMRSFMGFYNPKFHAYSASLYWDGNNDIYYDDNAQVASCYLTAYEVTQDKHAFLDKAVENVNFLMTGYEKHSGGVKWHVDKDGSNTCTTAEVGIACARLARFVTNNKVYLNFAYRCFRFLFDKMRDPDDGLICDGFEGKGMTNLNKTKWTYNQGTPLTLCALLYGFDQKDEYYEAARSLAKAASDTNMPIFDRDTPDHAQRYYQDGLSFYHLLCEGFADYLLFFGDRDPEVADAVSNVLNRHLFFIYKFLRNPGNEPWYPGTLKLYEIDEARAELFNKITGETHKPFAPRSADREGGDVKRRLAPSLMSMGPAARCFFQTARVLPHVNF